jgi:DNA repair exonuclease SbcCD ATPase subunit
MSEQLLAELKAYPKDILIEKVIKVLDTRQAQHSLHIKTINSRLSKEAILEIIRASMADKDVQIVANAIKGHQSISDVRRNARIQAKGPSEGPIGAPKVIQLPHFPSIPTIISMSDIHIDQHPNRANEYTEAFEIVINQARSMADRPLSALIVIVGDLFDHHGLSSPTEITLAQDFIRSLAKVGPVIITPGNHDLPAGTYRPHMDKISAITKHMANVYYEAIPCIFQADSFYVVSNVSIGDDNHQFIGRNHALLATKPALCLFHGIIKEAMGAIMSANGSQLSALRTRSLADFEGYEGLALGDIHNPINLGPHISYNGSLVQRNHGEPLAPHGFLSWRYDHSLHKFIHTFHPIVTNYGHVTITGAFLAANRAQIGPDVPKYVYLRAQLEPNEPQSLAEQLFNEFKLAYPSTEILTKKVSFKKAKIQTQSGGHEAAIESEVIDDMAILSSIVGQSSPILALHGQMKTACPKAPQSAPINYWRIDNMTFYGLYGYTRPTAINFASSGILGISGNNASGKSSILKVCMFGLFKKTPSGETLQDIVNKDLREYQVIINFTSGHHRGQIRRQGALDGQNKHKSKANEAQIWGPDGQMKIYGADNCQDQIEALIGTPSNFISYCIYSNYFSESMGESESKLIAALRASSNVQEYETYYSMANEEIKKLESAKTKTTHELYLLNEANQPPIAPNCPNLADTCHKCSLLCLNRAQDAANRALISAKEALDGHKKGEPVKPTRWPSQDEYTWAKSIPINPNQPPSDSTIGQLKAKLRPTNIKADQLKCEEQLKILRAKHEKAKALILQHETDMERINTTLGDLGPTHVHAHIGPTMANMAQLDNDLLSIRALNGQIRALMGQLNGPLATQPGHLEQLKAQLEATKCDNQGLILAQYFTDLLNTHPGPNEATLAQLISTEAINAQLGSDETINARSNSNGPINPQMAVSVPRVYIEALIDFFNLVKEGKDKTSEIVRLEREIEAEINDQPIRNEIIKAKLGLNGHIGALKAAKGALLAEIGALKRAIGDLEGQIVGHEVAMANIEIERQLRPFVEVKEAMEIIANYDLSLQYSKYQSSLPHLQEAFHLASIMAKEASDRAQRQAQIEAKRATLEAELKAIEAKLDLYREYKYLVSKSGLPAHIIRLKTGQVVDYVNSIFHVMAKCKIDIEDGNIRIIKANHTLRNIASLSGYESFILNIIFKSALNKFSLDHKGRLLFIDGSLNEVDSANTRILPELISYISDQYTKLIFIHHDTSKLQDIVDEHLVVVKEADTGPILAKVPANGA